MNNDWFITKLNNLLPSGFEAKKFNNMPRIHIKYDNYGFAVIDMNQNNYNLFAVEGLFPAIGIKDYEQITNMSNKKNRIMHISYEDTEVLEKVIKYVKANPSAVESKAVRSY